MKHVALALATSLLAPSVAHATGGAGLLVELQYLPRYGRNTVQAPGWVGCIGGVGYGVVQRRHLRLGGEGVWCSGHDSAVQMAYGGVQVGRYYQAGHLSFSAFTSIGFGVLQDGLPVQTGGDTYRSLFLYAKPTISVGVPLGFLNPEIGLFVNVPFNLAQWVTDRDLGRGVVTPTFGVQASLTFGDFRDPRKVRRPPPPPPPCPGGPGCAPPPPPPCGDCMPPPPPPPAPDDRPMAIPGGS